MPTAAPIIIEKELVTWMLSADALTDTVRNDAKTNIKDMVGAAIYNARRPRGTGALAITIERNGGYPNYALIGQTNTVSALLDISVFVKDTQIGPAPTLQALKVCGYLQRLLTGLRTTMGTVVVQQVEIEHEPLEDALEPQDASDKWLWRYVNPFQIWYTLAELPAD